MLKMIDETLDEALANQGTININKLLDCLEKIFINGKWNNEKIKY